MPHNLYILGAGPGAIDCITPHAIEIVKQADFLIGSSRLLACLKDLSFENRVHRQLACTNIDEIIAAIDSFCATSENTVDANPVFKNIVLLVSGDPGIFSMGGILIQRLRQLQDSQTNSRLDSIQIIPGISALQYFAAKIFKTWDDTPFVSLHGRNDLCHLLIPLRQKGKVFAFTGGINTPASICQKLVQEGLQDSHVTIGENLSLESEKITSGNPQGLSTQSFCELSMVYIELSGNLKSIQTAMPYADEDFIRGNVPMTKEEIRAISIAKLRLTPKSILFDVGAGTGSISIVAAKNMPDASVYAIEQNPEAIDLIRKNIEKFGTHSIQVVQATAPQGLDNLPKPDRIFIGGSGERTSQILTWITTVENAVRVVLNCITLDTAYEAIKAFETLEFSNIEITQVSIAKGAKAGVKTMLKALNPVYILVADKPQNQMVQERK